LIAAAARFEPRPYFTAIPQAGGAPAITLPPR
jgi:hypothetical protein